MSKQRKPTKKRLPGLLHDKSTGWYYSVVKDKSKPSGRARHNWAKTKAEAKRLYDENIVQVVADHAEKLPNELPVQPITDAQTWSLRGLAARYFEWKQMNGKTPSFLAAIKRHLDRFLDWLKEHGFNTSEQKLSDLNTGHLSGYAAHLASLDTINLDTANKCLSHVRMLVAWAEKHHDLSHPPLGAISGLDAKAKQGHGRRQNRKALEWSDVESLLAHGDNVDRALIMLGINFGFGNTDCATLKLTDVNLETGEVSHPRPKTGVEREFKAWPETVGALRAYLEKGRGKPKTEETGELFFVSRNGRPLVYDSIDEKGKQKRVDAIQSRIWRLHRRANVEQRYGQGFYSLRHTYATRIGEGSNDLREVPAALGHTTMQQAEVYRHDRKVKAAAAQERLRDALLTTEIPRILQSPRKVADENGDQKS